MQEGEKQPIQDSNKPAEIDQYLGEFDNPQQIAAFILSIKERIEENTVSSEDRVQLERQIEELAQNEIVTNSPLFTHSLKELKQLLSLNPSPRTESPIQVVGADDPDAQRTDEAPTRPHVPTATLEEATNHESPETSFDESEDEKAIALPRRLRGRITAIKNLLEEVDQNNLSMKELIEALNEKGIDSENPQTFMGAYNTLSWMLLLMDPNQRRIGPLRLIAKNSLVDFSQGAYRTRQIFHELFHDITERIGFLHHSHELRKVVPEMLKNFWKDEVSRPDIEVSEDGKQVVGYKVPKTRLGKWFKEQWIQLNGNVKLTNNYGSYPLESRISENKKEELKKKNQRDVILATVFYQFRAMIDERISREDGKEDGKINLSKTGQDSLPLPVNKEYSIVFRFGTKQKKIFITHDSLFSTSGKNDQELLQEFISKYKSEFFPTNGDKDTFEGYSDVDLTEEVNEITDGYKGVGVVGKYVNEQADPNNLHAADLQLSLVGVSEVLDVQQIADVRTNKGKFPVTMLIGIGLISMESTQGKHPIVNFGANYHHSYIDGAQAQKELDDVIEKAINSTPNVPQNGSTGKFDRIDTSQLFNELAKGRQDFIDGFKTDKSKRIREALGSNKDPDSIVSFYKEQYDTDISIHAILHFAMMMALNLDHTQFLQKRPNGVAPALTPFPHHWQEQILQAYDKKLSGQPLNDVALDLLLTAFTIQKQERNNVKNNKGVVPTFAVMTKLFKRKVNTFLGKILDGPATELLSDSALSSQLVGFNALEDDASDFSHIANFGTALSDIYSIGIGATDINNNRLSISVRSTLQKREELLRNLGVNEKNPIHDVLKKRFEDACEAIVYVLEEGRKSVAEQQDAA